MWEWLGEALAVDFANTTKRRGAKDRELLRGPGDLVEWAARQRGRVPAIAEPDAALDDAIAVRDDVKALLRALAVGAHPPTAAAGRVNARLRAAPLVPQLRGGDVTLAPAGTPAPLDELLARVAHSAIELVRDGGVGFCDAPSCGQFFGRRRASQRWCSDAC